MIPIKAMDIAKAVGGRLIGDDSAAADTVVTDSRKASKNSLFIAIAGENADGNDYIEAAFERGASIVLSERETDVGKGKALVIAKNSKTALLRLSEWYRNLFSIPIVGVTGSVGKTSTKDFIHSVLSVRGKALKTQGNFNNDIGLPLTVLGIDRQDWAAVIEMGMNHKGEIAVLTEVAKPDIAVITNIGVAHIENLGSREGILNAKAEIMEGMNKGGHIILCGDEPLLETLNIKSGLSVIYFGIDNNNCDIRAVNINTSDSGCTFDIEGKIQAKVTIPAIGKHNVYNALAAAAVGYILGMTESEITKGLSQFENSKMRQNIYKKKDITIIDDTYNANPDSCMAALSVLANMKGRKIAVLGDMLELGSYSEKAHRQIGTEAGKICDILYCVGELSKYTVDAAKNIIGDKAQWFANGTKLQKSLEKELLCGDIVLFKGSRGMKMEQIIAGVFSGENMV